MNAFHTAPNQRCWLTAGANWHVSEKYSTQPLSRLVLECWNLLNQAKTIDFPQA
jgi:hypothetical protein